MLPTFIHYKNGSFNDDVWCILDAVSKKINIFGVNYQVPSWSQMFISLSEQTRALKWTALSSTYESLPWLL